LHTPSKGDLCLNLLHTLLYPTEKRSCSCNATTLLGSLYTSSKGDVCLSLLPTLLCPAANRSCSCNATTLLGSLYTSSKGDLCLSLLHTLLYIPLQSVAAHAMLQPKSRVGQNRIYIYAVYDRIFDGFPAKNTVYIPYIYGSGQLCLRGRFLPELSARPPLFPLAVCDLYLSCCALPVSFCICHSLRVRSLLKLHARLSFSIHFLFIHLFSRFSLTCPLRSASYGHTLFPSSHSDAP
jgi:hypothetical protein